MSEKKFSIGDEIKISTTDLRANGKTGVIVGYEPDADCPYIVEFDGGLTKFPSLDYEWAFVEDELEHAQPTTEPAETGAGEADDYARLSKQVERGTAELRRYVEGNGFTWCDDEDTVFNVTTALGWMGGTIEALRDELTATRARLAAVEAARIQLGNMLFNLKQQPDMKRVTDSLESIMDSVGWDKS